MKKYYILMILFSLASSVNAQVGINTTDPKATLDVQRGTDENLADGIIPPRVTGDQLRINTNIYGADQDGAIVYITDPVTVTTEPKTTGITSRGLYIYNHFQPNANGTGLWQILPTGPAGVVAGDAYYASKTGGWTLVNLALGNSWQKVGLTGNTDTKLGNPAIFTDGVYTAPSTGTYSVSYELQFSGVDLNLLGGKSLGLVKNGTTLWDSKNLDAVRVELLNITLASVPLTSTILTSFVQLNSNDTLAFAVNTNGLAQVGVTLLTTAKVNIRIHKISN